jgi:integrase
MATIGKDPGGRRRILFVGPDGKRYTVRLGKCPQRTAEAFKVKIEALVAAALTSQSFDSETAAWVGNLDIIMAKRLAAVGLIPRQEKSEGETITLAAFIDQYIAARPSIKPNTLKNYRATKRLLVEFFGVGRLMVDITPGDCDEWHASQIAKGHAQATIGRNVKRAKQFFRAAVRKKLLCENPFAEIKAAAQVNKSREFYVSREAAEKIIAACPDAEWRLIVALARYGGLRTPSETFALTWGDIDWERGRIRVRSPKTECHAGGEFRMLPLFPELRTHLEAAFDQAQPGTTYVIARRRAGSANLRTQLERIMGRAGVSIWPRLFQNMRASRETELAQSYPLHVVTAWIGNSAPIAARHYLQVTESDFDRAAQRGTESGTLPARNAAQYPAAPIGTLSQETIQAPGTQGLVLSGAEGCDTVQKYILPPRGVEPLFSD